MKDRMGNRLTFEDKSKKLMERAIMHHTVPLIRAGLSVALGNIIIFKKTITGSERVHDEKEIELAYSQMDLKGQTTDGQYFFVSVTDPDVNAIDKLLTRAFGKPKETIDMNTTVDFLQSFRDLGLRALKEKDDVIDISTSEDKNA